MKVSQLIKVLEQLDPELEVYYVQSTGIISPMKSVQEVSYRGFKPETFVGLSCANNIEQKDIRCNPVYISTQKKQPLI